ncbi:type VI secretion system Vgr family protein [uncultured Cocleimonas sp.]|uniref:type VI secretion system Vgr family protein n=1 Tax=uncultured Cocleimonas sp. TaxID=1051587 RepID=UPI002614CC89|nr:type VI secretion system tip protein VgrG [uncultured Cocleimonas sp.]
MPATQNNSEVKIKTPLGPDVLLFRDMSMTEELGRLFNIDLDLLSEQGDINFEKILGENVTIELDLADGSKRYFNGHVTSFSQTGGLSRYTAYQATVRPWFWFLTRTADCRIFQEKSVPEIVKEIFRELGYTDFKDKLTKNYRTWEYCVQYRETDFNFVSRLLEQEGIYYYFTHEDGIHELVLSDGISAHQPLPGDYSTITFYPPDNTRVRKKEHIHSWHISKSVQPGKYVLNEFDFEKPAADLITKFDDIKSHQKSDYEIYDYPGEYIKTDDGDKYAQARIEELHSEYEQVQGQSGVRVMKTGDLFTLDEFSRSDQNRQYLITGITHDIHSYAYDSSDGDKEDIYSNRFSVIESNTPYRPARITPKPIVQGSQTAIVVGPSGEEIHTDQHARVKLQFHWDRYGKSDENSSCWVRVAQLWAGRAWGGIHIPRIGQEVIVDFMEGDPDRPIITGRVYNGEQKPPYDLPANKTQSGIKSRSSKGGTGANFNEIRMEDKKGSEELYLHAEKNHTNITENDRNEDVGHDRSLHVGHDKSEAVDNNKSITIGVDHTEAIGKNKQLSVGVNHSEQIGSNMTISVGSNLTETVGINYAETVGVAMELTIGATYVQSVGLSKTVTLGTSKSESIGTSKTVSIGSDQSEEVGANKSISIGENLSENIGDSHSEAVVKDYSLTAKTISMTAEDSITLTTGKASITMKKDGTINIKGKDITIKGSGKINAKASKNIVMKGKNILQN